MCAGLNHKGIEFKAENLSRGLCYLLRAGLAMAHFMLAWTWWPAF